MTDGPTLDGGSVGALESADERDARPPTARERDGRRPSTDPRVGHDAVSDEPGDAPRPAADRRTFLRRLSGQAIEGAGRIGGMSQVVRRSVFAAGEAVTRELSPEAAGDPGASRDPDGSAVSAATSPAQPQPTAPRTPPQAPPLSPPPARQPAPAPTLSAEQEAHLRSARSATLAVNDPSGHPHLTASWFHWDGAIVRLPTGFFTARATNIARDPRVSIVVEAADGGGWVAITGTAELVAGQPAVAASRPLFEKYLPDQDPVAVWTERDKLGDQAIVIVRPERFTWRLE
jgi:hypothetical protein